MNPSCVRFSGTPRPILNGIDEFQAILDGGDPSELTVDLGRAVAAKAYDRLRTMKRVRLIGDIAFYYLTYVERIIARNPNVRFVWLLRDRDETIESWMQKSGIERWRSKRIADRFAAWITREPYHEGYNYWMEHDGTVWRHDPVWDKCFPKLPGPTKREAIAQYYDQYIEQMNVLLQRHPQCIRMVRTETLNDSSVQESLLAWIGVSREEMVFTDAHIHRSRPALEVA
jgi:hypothetical protein